MSFNAIRENKVMAKYFEFTVFQLPVFFHICHLKSIFRPCIYLLIPLENIEGWNLPLS